ncbi:MAG: bifunctional DNA primase/polymerase, partial [Planctomycetaceae bacterium]|nr:bifunctional DNA primase/polymerase [Planctomycetaceae bacterium]
MQDHTSNGGRRQGGSPSTSIEWALAYWRRGWSIIPIASGSKAPACRSWKAYQDTRADESQIRRWFAKPEGRGVAVLFGDVSGGL